MTKAKSGPTQDRRTHTLEDWTPPHRPFSITRWLRLAQEAEEWYAWLSSRGIPCAIVAMKKFGWTYFAVYRNPPVTRERFTETDHMKIVVQANGFSTNGGK